jgi:hypothetical protein
MSGVVRVLETIEDVLLRGDDDARNLWDILSALRGPDEVSYYSWETKARTTVHMRRAAFPRLARKADIRSIDIPADFRTDLPYREPIEFSHFATHLVDAVTAPGRIGRMVE